MIYQKWQKIGMKKYKIKTNLGKEIVAPYFLETDEQLKTLKMKNTYVLKQRKDYANLFFGRH